MDRLSITPIPPKTVAEVSVPGSKSYTNRALLLASLTKGSVKINNALLSDDTESMLNCFQQLGVDIEVNSTKFNVIGNAVEIENTTYELNAGLSGTTMRFMLALSTVIPGQQTLRGGEGLEKRPIGDLVEVLRSLGAEIDYLDKEGFPPLKVTSSKLNSGKVKMSGAESSQYLSALLMIAPFINGLDIELTDQLVSRPYVDMTLSILREFGVKVLGSSSTYKVEPGQRYNKSEYNVEGDFSSAAYFFAIAALNKSTITVNNLNPKSEQADKEFLNILERMGNIVKIDKSKITLVGHEVKSLEVDMQNCPDQAQTMAVLAAFAPGKTVISGVQSLRVKETERVMALENELAKMGIQTESTKDTLIIHGGNPKPATIATYGDHRMAMSFAVAGSSLPGVVIEEPAVVTKTFPGFWVQLSNIGVKCAPVARNIVLIGMRGTGKTTIGRLLADHLSREHIDLDDVLSAKVGKTTAGIVLDHGWDYFRKLESETISSIQDTSGKIISTGGGVVLSNKNVERLKQKGQIIWLSSSPDVLAQRRANEKSSRPALTQTSDIKSEIATVFEERKKLYEMAADLIIQTDDLSAEEVADQIALCKDLTKPASNELCVIIGDPVKHSLSPAMHAAGYKALGLTKFQYAQLQVSSNELKTFVGAIRSLGIRGVSVTIPHKVAIMSYLEKIDDTAKVIGAVNTVVNEDGKLTGYNTDWLGVIGPLQQRTSLKGKKVAILGAGGSARAAVYALTQQNSKISIYNRTLSKAENLTKVFGGRAYSLHNNSSIADADIIINTTAVGLNNDGSPIPSGLINEKQIVFDLVYQPGGTPLLQAAQLQGAEVINGGEMLLHQGLAQFTLYTGKKAPKEAMKDAIQVLSTNHKV